ncbi:hypothetical protein Skr01_20130 [Sphaerisporangium krabiense]|uniref:Putative Ser/Thr protein kinase n=1 Tax=Sphaerisporangium krabiense TaxID=763782 RepID=A0A7W8Z5F9_9ACTN|nr:serine/threonine-protein kinase [Sphaerisporangium krabiense]MBB5627769.1 putative Ser/Thr protein kinase [Sphaerisporangium krabiense]GII61928.1 hypothetical protein Skr01_20130 [Sphaerisporangium krabiense]
MKHDDRLGPYRLLRRLGEGGMGVVHLALDSQGRQVAVKVLRAEVTQDDVARRRLAREVETMRRVRSRNIAEVLDADVTGSRPYIVTRYVPGMPLDDTVKRDGALAVGALVRVAHGVAEALAAVHAAGVIHRDLKPGNVLLLDGEPVLIDFGIAQAVDATRLTQTGMFIGTPGYLAPEIIEGHEAGPEVDVHAWAGTVLYAATGQPPFGKGTLEMIFYNITAGRANVDAAPALLRPLLRAAFHRDPAKRPTAAQLATQLVRLVPPRGGRANVPDDIMTVPDMGEGQPHLGPPPGTRPVRTGPSPAGGPLTSNPAAGTPVAGPLGTGTPVAGPSGATPLTGPAGVPVAGSPATGLTGSPVAGPPTGQGPAVPPRTGHSLLSDTGHSLLPGPATGAAGVPASGPGGPREAVGTQAGEYVSLLGDVPQGAGPGDPWPTVRVTGEELRDVGLSREAPTVRPGPGVDAARAAEGDLPTRFAPPAPSRPWTEARPGSYDQGEVPTRRVRPGEVDAAGHRSPPGATPGQAPRHTPGTASPQAPGSASPHAPGSAGSHASGSASPHAPGTGAQQGYGVPRDRATGAAPAQGRHAAGQPPRSYHQALFEASPDIFEKTPHVRQQQVPAYPPTVRLPSDAQDLAAGALASGPVYGVASLFTLLIVIGAAVAAPVIVAALVVVAAVLLRAADIAQPGLNAARPLKAAAGDVLRVLGRPGALVKSVGLTVALLPYGLILGVPVALVLAFLARSVPMGTVLSWGVAVSLAVVCAGPGVVGPGRQLTRTFASASPSKGAAVAVTCVLGVLAAGAALYAVVSLVRPIGDAVWSPVDMSELLERLGELRGKA